jgi:hypothetical protein
LIDKNAERNNSSEGRWHTLNPFSDLPAAKLAGETCEIPQRVIKLHFSKGLSRDSQFSEGGTLAVAKLDVGWSGSKSGVDQKSMKNWYRNRCAAR